MENGEIIVNLNEHTCRICGQPLITEQPGQVEFSWIGNTLQVQHKGCRKDTGFSQEFGTRNPEAVDRDAVFIPAGISSGVIYGNCFYTSAEECQAAIDRLGALGKVMRPYGFRTPEPVDKFRFEMEAVLDSLRPQPEPVDPDSVDGLIAKGGGAVKIQVSLKVYADSEPLYYTVDVPDSGVVKVCDGVHIRTGKNIYPELDTVAR